MDFKKVQRAPLTDSYMEHVHQKVILLMLIMGIVFITAVYAVSQGTYDISFREVLWALIGKAEGASRVVIANIRLPRVVAAVICGWGLSLSGLCIQSILKNPLGSPSTLGISQGAAFGAALSIVFFNAQVFSVTVFAFGGAVAATCVILILARLKRG